MQQLMKIKQLSYFSLLTFMNTKSWLFVLLLIVCGEQL